MMWAIRSSSGENLKEIKIYIFLYEGIGQFCYLRNQILDLLTVDCINLELRMCIVWDGEPPWDTYFSSVDICVAISTNCFTGLLKVWLLKHWNIHSKELKKEKLLISFELIYFIFVPCWTKHSKEFLGIWVYFVNYTNCYSTFRVGLLSFTFLLF